MQEPRIAGQYTPRARAERHAPPSVRSTIRRVPLNIGCHELFKPRAEHREPSPACIAFGARAKLARVATLLPEVRTVCRVSYRANFRVLRQPWLVLTLVVSLSDLQTLHTDVEK